MAWFGGQFGRARLHGRMLLPTDEHFPGVYRGSDDDVRAVVDRLARHMGVDYGRLDVEIVSEDDSRLSAYVPITSESRGAAGHYQERDGRCVITIAGDQARRPMALIATVAHELGHVLLLGDRRIDADREDHEPLTDLLTVYFGLGVFAANAALERWQEVRGEYGYTSTARLGYLTEPMYGYALARYAWLRGETDPDWARYLDTNPRAFLKRGLRYVKQAGSAGPALAV